MAPYAATKAGVINMIRTAAMEYGSAGIRLNVICPVPIATPAMQAHEKNLPDPSVLLRGMAIARLGTPREVAELAAWLLSPRPSFVTGQAIAIDGGFAASFS